MKGLALKAIVTRLRPGYNANESLAAERIKHGINVNYISPSYALTLPVEKFPRDHREYEKMRVKLILLKSFAGSIEVVGAVRFLVSSASEYITGQNVVVDRGYAIW